jgi:hypothetical protein
MTPGEAFAEDLVLRATSALTGSKGRREVFAIGGVEWELAAPYGADENWLGRAFFGAERRAGAQPSNLHRLSAWDGMDPLLSPPNRPWGPTGHEPLGVVASHSNDFVRCAFDIHSSSLIVYDYRHNASYTWFPSISELAAWAKASPFRIALSWLLNCHGIQIVHGAAVAMGKRAVLIAGAGGTGKSTTALACALSGLGYLGDDYCAIDSAAGSVHMVYRTAKVLPSTLAMLPSLEPLLVNRDRVGSEKGVVFLEDGDVMLVRSAELRAILLPRLSKGHPTTLHPASRPEAIRAILPSTIGGLMGGTSATVKFILELICNVPAFHLDLGDDLTRVVEAVVSRLSVH